MTKTFSPRFRAAPLSSARALLALCVGFGPSWVSAAELRLDDQNSGAAPVAGAQSPASARAAEAALGTTRFPSAVGVRAERTCLVLKNTVTIDGASQKAYGMICAGKDGVWRLVPF